MDEISSALYVAQCFNDGDEHFFVHNTSSLRQISVIGVVSFAAVNIFRLFAHDVAQAYFQSEDKLTRAIFLLLKLHYLDIILISEDEILTLNLPLYGTCNANDYCGVTIYRHIRKIFI